MNQEIRNEKVSDNYLETLEEVKKQYQQYLDVSGLYQLPIFNKDEEPQYQPPSPEHPLTTNWKKSNA